MDKLIIRQLALENAVKYKGKANPGAIIGKIIAEDPDAKSQMKELSKDINHIIKEVNKLSLEKQKEELKLLNPDFFEKKKEKKERNLFSFFNIGEGEKIKTAFPPGPEKYPHLGHAKSALLNYMLAKQYGGKFSLRFEDTNPDLVKEEFYKVIEDNLSWLGIKWDELVYASDYMKKFYSFAEDLIKQGKAYVDFTLHEEMKEERRKGLDSRFRITSPEVNMTAWKEMSKQQEGSCVLRMKIDMKHKNTTMRDPTIFRIIKKTHPRTKDKYVLWPTYDFENSVMDGLTGITHRIRTKEFELRAELQRYIQDTLGLPVTQTYEMGRFNLEGVPSSGRIIREKIESGELIGWDDPKLTTIVALKRRGFTPEGLNEFVISTGVTKSESTLEWDDLIIHNRRVLDKEAKRYFFISDDKVKITIEDAPEQVVKLKRHPDSEKRERKFNTGKEFYIEKKDYESLKEGNLYRLMDCLNFKKEKDKFIFDSTDHEKYKQKGKKIIHFLPANGTNLETEIMMPDKTIIKGISENSVKLTKVNDIVQFERFGFVRLDSIENSRYRFWFTH
ncbi:MAG: glutamate--tRNA ligase [Candidatus Woesearchaeota archaeon]